MPFSKEQVRNAVCLILSYNKNEELTGRGTGVYFGGGWIMTVAHNFQDDNEDNPTTHSILSDGRFEVKFHIEGEEYVFGRQKRMAFVHHLEPGEYTDFRHKDIAMVKLGEQWQFGRSESEFSEWENEEEQKLNRDNMKANCFALAEINPKTPTKGEAVYAAHYGGVDPAKKNDDSKIIHITDSTENKVAMLHLDKKKEVLPAGASGCPIMGEIEGKYSLLGLHFSGDDDDIDGQAEALPWNAGIQEYLQAGVGIISCIGSYMAYSKMLESDLPSDIKSKLASGMKSELAVLEEKAKKEELTIYLSDGQVINQQ